MKTILGTGQLGIAVMEALLKANPGEEITMVNRSGKLDLPLPANVKVVTADVTNEMDMEAIANTSQVIFSSTDMPYPTWGKFYPATSHALASALRRSSARLIFADNLYSYGNVTGKVMHENMPHAAQTKKGIIRASVIKTLLESPNGNRVGIVKAADFIGPRIHKGIFGTDFLKNLYNDKRVVLSGSITLPHTFTYIHDFAMALVKVSNSNDAFGQIWHVPNAPAMSLEKWVHLFEVMTSKKAKVTLVPKSLVRIAGVFNPLLKELYELAYQLEYPYLVDHSKYASRFGAHVTCPSNIVKETVQWYNTLRKIA